MVLAVGLMSGTSMDGIDAALIKITGKSPHLKIRLLHWMTCPFPPPMRRRLLAISHHGGQKSGVQEICRLNFELGELLAASVFRLCKKAHLSPSRISVIGSHGQTICHLGNQGTLQIGEPSIIAERTGVTTVADFRPRDIACGGFGAPLAPYLHYLLFRDIKKNRAVHNLGGISNLTYLPKTSSQDVIGFDTGPGNMIMDGLARKISNHKLHLDPKGRIAARGLVSLKLLKELLSHPFILKKPPKTAGREEFGESFVKRLLKRGRALKLRDEDLMATATALTAVSLAENYRNFVFPKSIPDEIIFGGGGVHNVSLMKMIRAELHPIRVTTFDDYGMSVDAAEAVCFGVLAYETLHGVPTNIPGVTGARHYGVLGKIIPGKRRGTFEEGYERTS